MARITIQANDQASDKLRKVRREIQDTDKSIDKLSHNNALKDLESEFNKLGNNTKEAKRLFNEYKDALESGNISKLEQIENEVRNIGKATEKAKDKTESFKSSLMGFAKTVGSLYLVKQAFDGIANVTKDFFDTAWQWQTYENRLSSFISTQSELKGEMSRVKDFAMEYNQSINGTIDAFIKMKTYGIDPSNESLKTFTNTAIGSGKSLDQFVEAMADAFMGENERLKEFGVKASVVGEQVAYNWTNSSGQAMNIIVDNNAKVIESTLSAIFNEKYIGQMDAFATSWGGMTQGLINRWDNFKLQLADEGLFGYFQALANTIIESLGTAFDSGAGSAKGFVEFAIRGVESVVQTVAQFVQWGKGIALVFDGMKVAFYGVVYGMSSLIGTFVNGAGRSWVHLKNAFGSMADGMGRIWHNILSSMGGALNNFLNKAISALNNLPGVDISKTAFGKIGAYHSSFKKATYEANKFFNTDWSKNKLTSSLKDFNSTWGDVAKNSPVKFADKLISKTREAYSKLKTEHKSYTAERKKAEEALTALGAKKGVYKAPPKATNNNTGNARKIASNAHKASIRNAKKLADTRLKLNNDINDRYLKATNDKYDYEALKAKQQHEKDLKNGADKFKAETIYQNRLAEIEQRRYDANKRLSKQQEKAHTWSKETKALASVKASAATDFMTIAQQRKAVAEAGQTMSGEFLKHFDKYSKKSFRSTGAIFGDVAGKAISQSLSQSLSSFASSGNMSGAASNLYHSGVSGMMQSGEPTLVAIGATLQLGEGLIRAFSDNYKDLVVNKDKDNKSLTDAVKSLNGVMNPQLEYTKQMAGYLSNMEYSLSKVVSDLGRSKTGLNLSDPKSSKSLGGAFSKSKNVTQQGIEIGKQSLETFLNSIQANSFQNIKTKERAFGFAYSTRSRKETGVLSDDIKSYLTSAIASEVDALKTASKSLGKSLDLSSVQIDSANLEMSGTPEENLQVINGFLAKQGENILNASKLNLKEYATYKESGGVDTTVRVASQVEQAKYQLKKLGIEAINFADVTKKATGAFDLELMRDSILLQEGAVKEFYKKQVGVVADVTSTITAQVGIWKQATRINDSDLTGIGDWVKAFQGTNQEFVKGYKDVTRFQDTMRVFGNKFSEFSADMIRGAGSLDALMKGQDDYYSNFFTKQEQSTIKLSLMNKEFGKLGLALPKTKDGFRDLVESFRDTDKEMYGALLGMSGGVAKVLEAEKELNKARLDNVEKIRDLYFSTASISQADKATYANALFKDAMKRNNFDDSLKYGKQNVSSIESSGFGLADLQRVKNINDSLSQKYGDKVKVQEVTDAKNGKKLDILVAKIEAIEAELKNKNFEERISA